MRSARTPRCGELVDAPAWHTHGEVDTARRYLLYTSGRSRRATPEGAAFDRYAGPSANATDMLQLCLHGRTHHTLHLTPEEFGELNALRGALGAFAPGWEADRAGPSSG